MKTVEEFIQWNGGDVLDFLYSLKLERAREKMISVTDEWLELFEDDRGRWDSVFWKTVVTSGVLPERVQIKDGRVQAAVKELQEYWKAKENASITVSFFKITKVTVLQRKGYTDTLWLKTDLPGSLYDVQFMEFQTEVAAGKGVDYASNHLPNVPLEVIHGESR